jgi:4-amino-4-deoxy-L-arabinose transferase-like glycosyltransferase
MKNIFTDMRKFVYGHALILILCVAFLLRVFELHWFIIEYSEFYRDYFAVSGILHGHFLLLGPPSILGGFHFGVLYYYFLAPFLLLFGMHPQGILFGGIAASVTSVWLLYLLVSEWADHRTALLAALLCAISGYGVFLASYISNPNIMPMFVLWFLLVLTRILRGSERWVDWLLLGLSFGCATQLHATAMAILPLLLISTLAIRKVRMTAKQLVIFLGTFFLTYLPYIVSEALHGFANLKDLAHLSSSTLGRGQYLVNAGSLLKFGLATLTPFQTPSYDYTMLQPNWLSWFVAAVALIFLGSVLWNLLRMPSAVVARPSMPKFSPESKAILWSWLCATIVVSLCYKRYDRYYYLIILWPMPMIVLAWALSWLRSRLNVFVAALLFFVVISATQIFSIYSSMPRSSWSDFYPAYYGFYVRYPKTLEIGSPGNFPMFTVDDGRVIH